MNADFKPVSSYDALRKAAGAKDIPLSASEIGVQSSHRSAAVRARLDRLNQLFREAPAGSELKEQYRHEAEKLEKLLASGEMENY